MKTRKGRDLSAKQRMVNDLFLVRGNFANLRRIFSNTEFYSRVVDLGKDAEKELERLFGSTNHYDR